MSAKSSGTLPFEMRSEVFPEYHSLAGLLDQSFRLPFTFSVSNSPLDSLPQSHIFTVQSELKDWNAIQQYWLILVQYMNTAGVTAAKPGNDSMKPSSRKPSIP